MKRAKKIILMLALILCIVVGAVFGMLSYLRISGEESLTDTSALSLESGEEWEAGWVRYNGDIYEYDEGLVTILVMGIDEFDPVSEAESGVSGGQADSLFLLIADTKSEEIKILAINRAAMTGIEVYDEDGEYLGTETAQICLQHGYGDGMEISCERQMQAVSTLLYGLDISAYISVNMGAIPSINDAVDGVSVTVLEDIPVLSQTQDASWKIADENTRNLEAGETYVLSGLEAYWYVKYRDTEEENSAAGRLLRQKQYLYAFADALKDAFKENPLIVLDLYETVSSYVITDLALSEITYLASELPSYSIDETVYELEGETVTGEAGSESGSDEFYVDEDALYELMLELFYEKQES